MRRFIILILAGFISSHISAQTIHSSGAENNTLPIAAEAVEAHIYPNPVSSTLYLAVSEKMAGSTIRVYNVLGSEVISYELGSIQNAMDVSAIQEGIYIYRIIDKNDRIILTGKFNKK